MNIAIRCDSSIQMGTGHVMRCMTLANMLKDRGHKITFLCRILEGNIISLIEEKQFKVIRLKSPSIVQPFESLYDSWREVILKDEIKEVTKSLESFKPEWMIVDHYGLNSVWEDHFMSLGIRLFILDDLYRIHICNGLLDQNATTGQTYQFQNHKKKFRAFLGPEYALLSDSFFSIKPRLRAGNVTTALVFFGGSDPKAQTIRFLRLCREIPRSIKFNIVIGLSNQDKEDIILLSSKLDNTEVHIQTKEMAKLMDSADLFIGSGGTITWERCYLGLPGLCLSVAENQENIAQKLHQAGVHSYLGRTDEITDTEFINAIHEIINNERNRVNFSRNSLALNVGSKTYEILDFLN